MEGARGRRKSMIKQDDLFPIGQIQKPHGIKGELSFSFTTDAFDRDDCRFFILDIDAILVPFFVAEYRFKSRNSGFVSFEDINSDNEARELCGKTIYIHKQFITTDNHENVTDARYFVGFEVIDNKQHTSLGNITAVNDNTANILFELSEGDLLIPFSEEYIVDIDHLKRQIQMLLPEGLLDL